MPKSAPTSPNPKVARRQELRRAIIEMCAAALSSSNIEASAQMDLAPPVDEPRQLGRLAKRLQDLNAEWQTLQLVLCTSPLPAGAAARRGEPWRHSTTHRAPALLRRTRDLAAFGAIHFQRDLLMMPRPWHPIPPTGSRRSGHGTALAIALQELLELRAPECVCQTARPGDSVESASTAVAQQTATEC